MTQEEKELLLRDLCGRIPYGVKCEVYDRIGILDEISSYGAAVNYNNGEDTTCRIECVKPYLFPLSSMTEEQTKDFYSTIRPVVEDDLNEYSDYEESEKSRPVTMKSIKVDVVSVNWMLKNHFDINGLIPKNLAIDATNLNVY